MVWVSQHCCNIVVSLLRGGRVVLHQGFGRLEQLGTRRVAEGLYLLLSEGDQGVEEGQRPVNGAPDLMGGGEYSWKPNKGKPCREW